MDKAERERPDGLDVRRIAERAEKATPGPWLWITRNRVLLDEQSSGRLRTFEATDNDMQFIAHAREDIPALLQALAAADRDIQHLRTFLDGTRLKQERDEAVRLLTWAVEFADPYYRSDKDSLEVAHAFLKHLQEQRPREEERS